MTGAQFANALRIKAEFAARFDQMLSSIDALVCPTEWCAAGIYSEAEVLGDHRPIDPSPWTHDVFNKPTNFTGSPTLSMPSGFSEDGMPLSVQFVGKHLSESLCVGSDTHTSQCRSGTPCTRRSERHKTPNAS